MRRCRPSTDSHAKRARLEREIQLLEGERQLPEQEEESLSEERERWGKAREGRVPQGPALAFKFQVLLVYVPLRNQFQITRD